MDFALTEEQQLLAETLRKYLTSDLPPSRVRELVADEPGGDGGSWKTLCELGVAGLLVPEELGGSGLRLLDAAVAAESLAWGVAPAPFLGSAVMAPVALRAGGSREQRERWLPRLADGEVRVGVAAQEMCGRRDAAGVDRRGDRISGRALMVVDGIGADHYLVAADRGESLAFVSARAPGLACIPLRTLDRTRSFCALELDECAVDEWIGEPGGAEAISRRMLDAARIVLAADLLGASERAIELAVAYALERKQFDRVIGSFQAVKHLCAEMVAELEPARSLLWYAAHAFDAEPDEAHRMACHAKAHLAEVGPFVVRTATEEHGGIGFTDEQNLHYWFKRAGVDRQLLGTPEDLREEAARLQGWLGTGGT